MRNSLTVLFTFTLAGAAALALSCASRESNKAPKSAEPPAVSSGGGVPIPGFQALGSPQARRKPDILARFGAPASEENLLNGRYSLLAYPVTGWNENLLILFAGEELLGFSRESSRTVLESTLQHHARAADGSFVVYQSWVDGQTTYFRTAREKLRTAPPRKKGSPPPLLDAQALEIARLWLKRTNPDSSVQPTIQGIHDVPSVPGAAFYVAGVFDFQAKRMNNLVILMDGTIITGEPDVKP